MQLSMYPDQWNDSQPINLFAGDLFNFYIKLEGKRSGKVGLYISFPSEIEYKKAAIIIEGQEFEIPSNDISLSASQPKQKQPVTVHIETDGESVIKITAVAIKHFFWGNKTTELVKIQCKEKNAGATRALLKEMPVLITPVKIQLYLQSVIDIFGYSLIGIISYCFGLILNWYNISKDVHSFATLIPQEQSVLYPVSTKFCFPNTLVFILAFQLIFICLFSHSYAKAYLLQNQQAYKDEVKLSIYMTIGKWIELIAVVCFAMAIFAILVLGRGGAALRVVFINGLLFGLSTMRYRLGKTMPEDERYLLVCPAILMIGLNVFLGASIDMFLNRQYLALVGVAVFACFFLSMYCANNEKTVYHFYIVFLCVLAFVGVLSFIVTNTILKLSFLNVFLGVVVSIYMAIFESWYIPFRQLHGKDKPKEKPYVHLVDWLLFFFPVIIAVLYPFQQFKGMYLITSFIGSFVAIIFWNMVVYPSIGKTISKKKRSGILITRALLGFLTLLFLMLDKVIPFEIKTFNGIDIAGAIIGVFYTGIQFFLGGKKKIGEIEKSIAAVNSTLWWPFKKDIFEHSNGYLAQFFLHQWVYLALVLSVLGITNYFFISDSSPFKAKITSVNAVLLVYFFVLVLIAFFAPRKTTPQLESSPALTEEGENAP